jgi:glycosyltransferase involved in cell wall biosynthesis
MNRNSRAGFTLQGFNPKRLAYFDMADVVVHASVFPEPFGRVIVEGMLACKPVIAAHAPAERRKSLQHEHTGLLVEPGNANELAGALTRLRSDSAFAAELAQNAATSRAMTPTRCSAVQRKIETVIRQTTHCETGLTPEAEANSPAGQAA